MHREIGTVAFVLRTRPYGESDRIVTLITREHGKLTGIAKGAKNSRRRFAGTLEPFVQIRAVFRQRASSDLVFLLRCEHLGVFRSFTRDLDLFAAGSYVLELTDRMVLGRESGHEEVYRLVEEVLGLLDAGAPAAPVLRAFELHLLGAAGYAPALDRCRGCGAPAGSQALYLAVERGGLVCRACVRAGEVVRPVAAATAQELARLATGTLAAAAAAPATPMLGEAAAVAGELVRAVASGPLHAREFLSRTR